MPSAWLITHDTHIDRRILPFAECFEELGFGVKLFAGYVPPPLCLDDPPMVVRAECRRVIQSVTGRAVAGAPAVPRDVAALCARVADCQERYRRRYGRCAARLSALTRFGLPAADLRYPCRVLAEPAWFALVVSTENGVFAFNSLTRRTALVPAESHAALKTLWRRLYEDGRRELGLPAAGAADVVLAERVRSGRWQQGGAEILWTHDSVQDLGYEYRRDDGLVIERARRACAPMGNHEVNGWQYDFIPFRRVIFDYSPILAAVLEELETQVPPEYVYVADLPTLPIGYMLRQAYGCKLLVDCHEWWKEQAVLWQPAAEHYIRETDRYEKELYPACDVRITVGEELAREMGEYFGCPFATVYSAPESPKSAAGGAVGDFWAERCALPPGTRVALFQGSLTTLRNLDNLAAATRFLEEGQALVIVGDGPYREQFLADLRARGCPERVAFAGWVAQAELGQYTQHADLGVLPYTPLNHYYSMSAPNKLFEYLTARLPIVCDRRMTEITALVNRYGVGCSVDCADPEALGTAIRDCLKSEQRLQEWRENYAAGTLMVGYAHQKKRIKALIREARAGLAESGGARVGEAGKESQPGARWAA